MEVQTGRWYAWRLEWLEMLRISLTKALACVVLLTVASGAFAGMVDGTVLINRAANNKSIAVSYDGVRATLVELRINGESIATRGVSDETTKGETSFSLNPALLRDGNNDIEVKLFDKSGKLVGVERTVVVVDRKASGPVSLKAPKSGSTITGPIQIEVEFKQDLKDVYVSFFVDDEFKSLRNFPPYSYLWDTSRVTNGWHEVQAWVVDKENNTHKTEKVRLYVSNPNGRTERMDPINPVPKTQAVDPTTNAITSGSSGYRTSRGATGVADVKSDPTAPKSSISGSTSKIAEPGLTAIKETPKPDLTTSVSDTTAVSNASGTRTPSVEKGSITGQRTLLPTGTRLVDPSIRNPNLEADEPANPSRPAIRDITIGSRLLDDSEFSVYLNGAALKFDVAPRVLDGVPFAPFRHLYEGAGGEVHWIHESKTVEAEGLGNSVRFKIGALQGTNNGALFSFERAPFLDSGRTIVPLSFVSSTLDIRVQYDPNTGHVLISSNKGK